MLLWPPFLAQVFPRNMQLSLAKSLVPAVPAERYYFGLLRPLHGNTLGNIEQHRVFADLSILYCQEEQFAWENWSSICVHHERSYYSPHIYGRTLSSNLLVRWRFPGPSAVSTSRTRFALVRNFSLTSVAVAVSCAVNCILPRGETKKKHTG